MRGVLEVEGVVEQRIFLVIWIYRVYDTKTYFVFVLTLEFSAFYF